MAAMDYTCTEIHKFEKNIKNVPEILGRVIVAVAGLLEVGVNLQHVNSRELDRVISFTYNSRKSPNRREYHRKFIIRNSEILEEFIRRREIGSKRTEKSKL